MFSEKRSAHPCVNNSHIAETESVFAVYNYFVVSKIAAHIPPPLRGPPPFGKGGKQVSRCARSISYILYTYKNSISIINYKYWLK